MRTTTTSTVSPTARRGISPAGQRAPAAPPSRLTAPSQPATRRKAQGARAAHPTRLRLPESCDDVSWPSQCERLAHLNQWGA